MANISSNKDVKIDILNNKYWAKILISIALGYNTYQKLRDFRRSIEKNKALAPAVMNRQFKMLLESGYIIENEVRIKYNKKEFFVQWSKLVSLFILHIQEKLQDKDIPYSKFRQKFLNEYKNLIIKYGMPKSKAERLNLIINDDFKDFLSQCLKKYIRSVDIDILLDNNFEYHFNSILESFLEVYPEVLVMVNQGRQPNNTIFSFVQLSNMLLRQRDFDYPLFKLLRNNFEEKEVVQQA